MLQRLSTAVTSTALVGPNSLFREGLKRVLPPPYQATTVAESIDSMEQTVALDLIILIAGADQGTLLAQVQRVRQENPRTRVVVMSDVDTSDVIMRLLVAGADSYLLRKISLESLLASLDVVMQGGTVVLPTPRNAFMVETADSAGPDKGDLEAEIPKLDAEAEYKKLSDRETDILLCLTKGESNKQIARTFRITEATVKVHLKAILRKIRVSNRTQAAVWAHHNYVARPARPPQPAPLDFRQEVLVAANQPGAYAFSCPPNAAPEAA